MSVAAPSSSSSSSGSPTPEGALQPAAQLLSLAALVSPPRNPENDVADAAEGGSGGQGGIIAADDSVKSQVQQEQEQVVEDPVDSEPDA